MPQIHGASSDVAERVGATALGIAAARAAETAGDNPIIQDPFAQVFVDAAGIGVWNVMASPKLLAELSAAEPGLEPMVRALIGFTAVRTAFLDEFFLDAGRAGIRQIVNLAAGLDSRAWRLPWPEGTTVYELDQPTVLEFKYAALRRNGATPTANVVGVPMDLRDDWSMALQEGGFDASQPTAWLAEGLLHYLPARTHDLLFDRVHALSSAASRFALNAPSSDTQAPAAGLRGTEAAGVTGQWCADEITGWLDQQGWETSALSLEDLLRHYGRVVRDTEVMPTVFISAHLPAASPTDPHHAVEPRYRRGATCGRDSASETSVGPRLGL
ncbi:SAM-dependent methyltransferase [Mycobacterium seoulense]|uniref:SAM-dependent methyltransferase n=1 Tax=Mycobacterium seoulense TaxID=386911 RepID=UPI003CE70240